MTKEARSPMTHRIYHFRGRIERGPRYAWQDGYSADGPGGSMLYPWQTRAECRAEAAAEGLRAVFYRDGRPESPREWRRRPRRPRA